MEIILALAIFFLFAGILQIQKKLDLIERRINEVESNLEEEIKNYGIDQYPDLNPYGVDLESDESDMLYEKAKELVLKSGKTQASHLQEKLRIGYARAIALIEKMEKDGILGPTDGVNPRKILKN